MPKLDNWIKNMLLILGGLSSAVFLAEAGLRVMNYNSPNFYQSDIHTGAALRPGIEGWWRKEGEAYIRINSDGLRDREHGKAKPPNTFRIAILGDSYAEAMQVPLEETFWAVLERELNRCQAFQGQQVEIINFGVAGYGTAQELMVLRHRVGDYSPDLVVLAFLSGNDVRNNLRALEQDPMRPYFVYHHDALVLDDSFRQYFGWRFRQAIMKNWGYWLIDHLRVLQLINEARYTFKAKLVQSKQNTLTSKMTMDAAVVQGSQNEAGLDTMVYLEPRDQLWEDAWKVTEGLIVQMRNEVRDQGADFLIVVLTNGDQVEPDPIQRRAYAERLGTHDLLYPERRITALGKREGIQVVTLAQAFADYTERYKVHLHGFKNGGGHWNSKGHYLAGLLISENVCFDFSSP